MKKAVSAIVLCVMVFAAVVLLKVTTAERFLMVFSPQETISHSPFNDVKGGIRIGVERVAVHRYYTIYSYVTGDQSHMEVLLKLEHLDQLAIQKAEPEIYIIDSLGNKLYPYPYFELLDFPADDPLGYILTLWVRFPPPEKEVTHIDINIKYLGETYSIKTIPIR